MITDNIEIEVEYTIQQHQRRFEAIPAEYREMMMCAPRKRAGKTHKFLLLIADSLIRTGNAIKNSQPVISDQKVYS